MYGLSGRWRQAIAPSFFEKIAENPYCAAHFAASAKLFAE
jgi:hypothetical protein